MADLDWVKSEAVCWAVVDRPQSVWDDIATVGGVGVGVGAIVVLYLDRPILWRVCNMQVSLKILELCYYV